MCLLPRASAHSIEDAVQYAYTVSMCTLVELRTDWCEPQLLSKLESISRDDFWLIQVLRVPVQRQFECPRNCLLQGGRSLE
jgi:hypothetical protein